MYKPACEGRTALLPGGTHAQGGHVVSIDFFAPDAKFLAVVEAEESDGIQALPLSAPDIVRAQTKPAGRVDIQDLVPEPDFAGDVLRIVDPLQFLDRRQPPARVSSESQIPAISIGAIPGDLRAIVALRPRNTQDRRIEKPNEYTGSDRVLLQKAHSTVTLVRSQASDDCREP